MKIENHMEILIMAHGSFNNQYNQFQVPHNCHVHYYQQHGEDLEFDYAYAIVRGLTFKNEMTFEATSQTQPGEYIVDYSLSTEGNMPIWPDIPFPSLGLYQIVMSHNDHPYFIKFHYTFPCCLSELVNGLALRFPNEDITIHVLSCRTFKPFTPLWQ